MSKDKPSFETYPTCQFLVSSFVDNCSPTGKHFVVSCATHDEFIDSDCFFPKLEETMNEHLIHFEDDNKKRSKSIA